VREGHHAEQVLFDPDRIEDAATCEDPIQPARRVHSVFVNGVRVWSNGKSTGRRSGTFITH